MVLYIDVHPATRHNAALSLALDGPLVVISAAYLRQLDRMSPLFMLMTYRTTNVPLHLMAE